MKKTNRTFLKIGVSKSVLTLIAGLFFLSLSVDTYAQGTAAALPASLVDKSTFEPYTITAEKEVVYQILRTEAETMKQNSPVGGAAEAEHALRLFFIYKTASKVNAGTEVSTALMQSYGLLTGYASAFNGTYNLEAIVTNVADLLD